MLHLHVAASCFVIIIISLLHNSKKLHTFLLNHKASYARHSPMEITWNKNVGIMFQTEILIWLDSVSGKFMIMKFQLSNKHY